MSGYVGGGVFARSREAFAQAEQWLAGPEAAGLGLAGLEDQLAARGREIQRRLLQDHLFARAAAEPRLARVTGPDGICRTRAERGHGRGLSSVFGPVVVSRIGYRAPGARNAYPADEQLGLPAGRHSPGLAKMVAGGVARGSVEQACVTTPEAILQLRALLANGDFDTYRDWHLDREHERNHPRTYALAA